MPITIHIDGRPESEGWDDRKQEFVQLKEVKPIDLELEHSLISVSKWEAKWHVPFISKENHTEEQTLDYIKCMTINRNVPDEVYDLLTAPDIKRISEYISDPMTATKISEGPGSGRSHEIITNEVIYAWMTLLNIPFDPGQRWHLNHLLTLINVVNAKNTPPKKMSRDEIIRRNKALNEARKKKYNTKG